MGTESEGLRLQKVLAQAGLASRREAERLIAAGKVTVNGKVVTAMGQLVDPNRDEISLNGKRIGARPELVYLVLNKPEGFIVSRGDPQGRPTVYDLLGREYAHLHPVGRLDGNSAGLLLLTNDGELTQHLMHPSHHVEKRYRVRVRGAVRPEHIQRLAAGVELDDGPTQPAGIRMLKPLARGAWIEFRLREGRNRQIRRMCELMDWEVERLERQQIGPLKLGALPEGKVRRLGQSEVAALRREAGLEASPEGKRRPDEAVSTTARPRQAQGANKAKPVQDQPSQSKVSRHKPARSPQGKPSHKAQASNSGKATAKERPTGNKGKSSGHRRSRG